MPVMVVGARNVCPAAACQCPEHSHSCNELRKRATRAVAQTVEEEDQQESRARTDCDEDLEDRTFRIAIANGSADGRKPLDGIAEVLVLNDLVVVEGQTNNESPDESCVGGRCVEVRDPLTGHLEGR